MKRNRIISFSLVAIMTLAMTLAFVHAPGSNSDIYAATAANRQYSLGGAKYQLYTDQGCTAAATDVNGNPAVMTTDADGNTSPLGLEPNTYYAKETTASSGCLPNITRGGTILKVFS